MPLRAAGRPEVDHDAGLVVWRSASSPAPPPSAQPGLPIEEALGRCRAWPTPPGADRLHLVMGSARARPVTTKPPGEVDVPKSPLRLRVSRTRGEQREPASMITRHMGPRLPPVYEDDGFRPEAGGE